MRRIQAGGTMGTGEASGLAAIITGLMMHNSLRRSNHFLEISSVFPVGNQHPSLPHRPVKIGQNAGNYQGFSGRMAVL